MQDKWSLFTSKYEGCSKCFPHANVIQQVKYRFYTGITEPQQIKQDNSQQVSNVYLQYKSDVTVHCFIRTPCIPPQPLYTMSAEHSLFDKLKFKPVKALGGIFNLTQMSGLLFILTKDYKGTCSTVWLFKQSWFFVLLVRSRMFSYVETHIINPLNKNIQYNRHLV